MYTVSTLPNGLKIATAYLPDRQSVALSLSIGVGSRYETDKQAGISHFIEHMVFKGTNSRSVKQIALDIEGNGGSLNAYTSEDITCYEAKGPVDLLPLMLDVLTDLVLHPTFPEEEFNRERDVILEEMTMYKETPSDFIQELSAQALRGTHPLGRPIIGTEKSLLQLTPEDLKQFHQKHYFTTDHLLVVSGNIKHEQIIALAQKLYKNISLLTKPYKPLPFTRKDAELAPHTLKETRDIEQAHLMLSFLTEGRQAPNRYALRLLSVLTGESMSSRLFQEVREKRGLAYAIYSDISFYEETGEMTIYAGVDTEKVNQTLHTIRTELSRLKEHGCNEEELTQAKRYLLGQLTVALDTTSGQMNWIADSLIEKGTIILPEEHRAHLEEVTTQDIARVAQLLFSQTENLAIVSA